jgi:hypothetical protein
MSQFAQGLASCETRDAVFRRVRESFEGWRWFIRWPRGPDSRQGSTSCSGAAPVGGGYRLSVDIERDNTTTRSIWARERMNREGQGQKLDELVARSRRLRQEGITKEVIEPGARKARVARKVGV